jgi:kinesin family protein 5
VQEIFDILKVGQQNRHIGTTKQNESSSRSHSIFIIEILQTIDRVQQMRGVINLVDLAGSERVSKSFAEGESLQEAKKINQSLSTLGKVINSITKNAEHVPYRDSKLTRLLKESLGGNNKTTLIVNCSMHLCQIDETLSTLRFA